MADITGDGVNDYDITTAGSSVTIGTVIFTDAVNVGSGTGNYNTFLAISNNNGVETGFNSDDTPPIDGTNKDIDQAKTHTVKLSDLVIVTVGGVQYYQVRVDLNEANSGTNAQISLDQFKIYTSTNGTIESTTTLFNPANATLKYDMDAGGNVSVLLSDEFSSGSGNDDYAVLIPISTFAGQDPTTTFVYFDIQMGAASASGSTAWQANATFEEWNLENGVALTGTKFEDANNNGIKDVGEGPVAGVTIFIDSNQNGVFDAGERSTVTDVNGNYTFFGVALNQTLWIDEVVPAGATQTTGAHETVVIGSNATGTITVDPIGNHYLTPHVTISKDASVPGDCADTVGELVTYTVTVTNDGELALSNVVLTDSFEGGAGTIIGSPTGDTGNDGIMGVGEVWTYSYTHAVTQDDIDSNGGDGDGSLDNVATVNADSDNGSVSDNDDAAVEVCQNPSIAIVKEASVDGDCADTVGELVNYTIDVTNDGNVSLENVVVTDDLADVGSIAAVDLDADGFNDGDSDADGVLDVGETWNYTAYHTVTQDDIDSAGNYDSDADGTNDSLRNVATANATAVTTGDAADEVTDDAVVEVCQNPSIAIVKEASVDGDCADIVGELVNYTIDVTNDGNVSLENVVVTDDLADVGSIAAVDLDADGFNDGDSDADGVLDVGETWNYTAYHTVTQDDIDSAGNYDSDADGTNDSLRNVATANATAVTTGEAADEVTDDAVVEVCQNPAITLVKNVRTDVSGAFVPADNPDGPQASTSSTVDFQVIITNTGNVTLTDVTLSDSVIDTVGGVPGAPVAIDYTDPSLNAFIDLDADATLDAGEEWANFDTNLDGTLDIDENGDPFELSVGESFTIYYSLTSQLGQHENTAVVTAGAATTGDTATANDDANYYVVAENCVGVRTPGFWQNPKNGGQFWDGIVGNEKHAGEPGFADGDLLYQVDSNHNGSLGAGDVAGLLVGDYNLNGITDAGEDTIFISLADARTLINASNKQTADGIYMLGRDVVATWLNYLANNQETTGQCIGDANSGDGINTPREYLDASIDWFQQFASTTNGTAAQNLVTSYHDGDTQATFQFDGKIAPSSGSWQNAVTQGEDLPFSAAQMHSQLDAYNNTGAINGHEYCCDADSQLVLSVLGQINLV